MVTLSYSVTRFSNMVAYGARISTFGKLKRTLNALKRKKTNMKPPKLGKREKLILTAIAMVIIVAAILIGRLLEVDLSPEDLPSPFELVPLTTGF